MLIEVSLVNDRRIEVCQLLDGLPSTLTKDFAILGWIVIKQRRFLGHDCHTLKLAFVLHNTLPGGRPTRNDALPRNMSIRPTR